LLRPEVLLRQQRQRQLARHHAHLLPLPKQPKKSRDPRWGRHLHQQADQRQLLHRALALRQSRGLRLLPLL
jgi:hypothetical protein